MLIKAWYDHGTLHLPEELKTNEDRIEVVVDIPDDKIEFADYLNSIEDPELIAMMQEIRKVRGTSPAPAGNDDDKALFAEAIDQKMKESGESS
jgi:hypothetical protein